jgi:MYXO-CTERM domain-containing protein
VAPFCNASETCLEGECIDDPCLQIECPPTFDCVLFETTDALGDPAVQPICRADPDTYIPGVDGDSFLATGAGGCACQSTTDGRGAGLFTLLLLLFLWRRRRRQRADNGPKEVA